MINAAILSKTHLRVILQNHNLVKLLRNVCTNIYSSQLTLNITQHRSHRHLLSINKNVRLYCNVRNDPSIRREEEDIQNIYSQEFHEFNFDSLYPNQSKDCLLEEINKTYHEEELKNVIVKNKVNFESQHWVQSLMVLWSHINSNRTSNETCHLQILEDYILPGLHDYLPKLTAEELSCCYYFLRKFCVPHTHIVKRDVLIRCLSIISTKSEPVSLKFLFHLMIGINKDREFHTPTVCRNVIPHLEQCVNDCQNADDVGLISLCIINLQSIIHSDLLESFKNQVRHLLNEGKLNSGTYKPIVRLLQMLNMTAWSSKNVSLMRDLLLTLNESILKLNETELRTVWRIFHHYFEPVKLIDVLKKASVQQMRLQPTPAALSYLLSFEELTNRENFMNSFKELLSSPESWNTPHASVSFFHILRNLKISNTKLCNAYWEGVVKELDSLSHADQQGQFLRHCHRYMNFNNNLGGTYRYIPIEKKLCKMAMANIENDINGRIPSKFVRMASFVLAYGHTPYDWKKFPNLIISKIISMSEQFKIVDCFVLSRGLNIALELRFRYQIPSKVQMQLDIIDNVLIECIERLLETESLNPINLNMIARTVSYRKSLRKSVVYQESFNKLNEADYSTLNSRVLRNLAFILNSSNCLIPKALDAMFNYVEKNEEFVMGETVEKLLSCAYNLGYTPQSLEVLDYASAIIIRDFANMSGLSIVQACLALCYYKRIPEELINEVFCVNFIHRIEKEIQTCYSKATYPERVLNMVMQLNRTVCLDFPEANVPWFQQNFVEAQLTKKPVLKNKFSDDVKNLLINVLKDDSYVRCNHTTPYGYQIDFVIHFDKDKRPISSPVETTMLDRITKVAILLLKLDSFCDNNLTVLHGAELLKMRHLEMMGYKVLHINEHNWNSKYMNAPEAKTNYLKCLLKISNS